MKAAYSFKTSGDGIGFAVVAAVVAIFGLLAPAGAQDGAANGVTEVEIGCNDLGLRCREVFAAFEFPEEGIQGHLLLSFEEATFLTENTFEIEAKMVDPSDPKYSDRLPRDTFIPSDFPVLVKIEPRAGTQVSFRRNWTLELVSENLEFTSHTPFRLFRAPTDGSFQDISVGLGSGSYRVLGLGGSFSEFLIAADLRPIERVAGQKLVRLDNLLTAVSDQVGAAADGLRQLLNQAVQALGDQNVPGAIATLESFIRSVLENSGTEIPDDTRPGDGVEGIAARLITSAKTLQHTLVLGLESAQGGMSGFSRRLQAGGKSLELRIEFENAFMVDPEDLAISATEIGVHDPALLARLPDGVHVPEEFPVLVRINPKSGTDHAFGGQFEIEIQTDSLNFLGGSPLRLFKAPDGGAFEDITRTFGLGSYRVLGLGGSFSEFVIAEDLRPIASVVSQKFQDLASVFEANAGGIPAALRQELENAISQVQQSVEQGLFDEAIGGIEAVIVEIEDNSGESIPALWRSGEAVSNVAGELVSLLETLIFSLEIQGQPTSADPGDVNLDGQVDVGDIFFLIDQVFGDDPPPAELFFPPSTDEQK